MDKAFPISRRCGLRAVTEAGQRLTMPGGENANVRISNMGSSPCAILPGAGAQLAVYPTDSATPNGAGLVLPPGNTEIFSLPASVVDIHAICAAGGSTDITWSIGAGL